MMVGFGIVIMAIPEGLPLSVTIALAYSVHRMYLENNLVKKLKCRELLIFWIYYLKQKIYKTNSLRDNGWSEWYLHWQDGDSHVWLHFG